MRLIFSDGFMLVKYHLFLRSNLNFLHNYRWITFLTQADLVLKFFCANFTAFVNYAINRFISFFA